MRSEIAESSLVTYPKGGITLYTSTNVGFLTKSATVDFINTRDFITVTRYHLKTPDKQSLILTELEKVVEDVRDSPDVLSFWAIKPQESTSNNLLVVLFGRYGSRQAHSEALSKLESVQYVANLDTMIRKPMSPVRTFANIFILCSETFRSYHGDIEERFCNGADIGFIRNSRS